MTDPLSLAIATFAFTVFGTAITTTWGVSRMLNSRDRAFIKMMTDHEVADVERFASVGREIVISRDTLRSEFGETGSALRQKMTDMELWGRDNNVHKSSFYHVTNAISASITALGSKIDGLRAGQIDIQAGTR